MKYLIEAANPRNWDPVERFAYSVGFGAIAVGAILIILRFFN